MNPLVSNGNAVVAVNAAYAGQPTAPGVTFAHLGVNENGRTGSETTYVYEGDYYPIKAQQNICRNYGVFQMFMERIQGSNQYRLTATYPFNEQGREDFPLLGTFEIDIEMSQPSVFANPVLNGITTGAPLLRDGDIALVRRVCSDFQAGDYSITTTVNGSPVTDGGWNKAIQNIQAGITDQTYQDRAIQLFATVCRFGTETYIEYYSVFKRTITVALPGQVEEASEGWVMVWTSEEVSGWEGIPPTGFFQLDPAMQWLKTKPNVVCGAAMKTQLSYSYTEFKQGNGLLYLPWGSAQLLYASPDDLPQFGT